MELYEELLICKLAKGEIKLVVQDSSALVESACYQALCQIKKILQDETLEDHSCFLKIEEVICLLEDLGIDCGDRHDF